MENYFNYFTEIEECFQRRRGGILLLSTLDWALIETWKDAGIPLQAVLRGIDAAFDRYEKRPSQRKVNSLAYCAQEVLAAAEEMKEAAVGGRRRRSSSRGRQGFDSGGDCQLFFGATRSNLSRRIARREGNFLPEASARDGRHLRELAAELESKNDPCRIWRIWSGGSPCWKKNYLRCCWRQRRMKRS